MFWSLSSCDYFIQIECLINVLFLVFLRLSPTPKYIRTYVRFFSGISGSSKINSQSSADLENTDYLICPNNCGRRYKYKRGLRAHLKYNCGVPKQFSCKLCGKLFARKCNYKTHLGLMHCIIMK